MNRAEKKRFISFLKRNGKTKHTGCTGARYTRFAPTQLAERILDNYIVERRKDE